MKIFSASNPTEAHIICGLMKQQNIQAEVRDEGLFSLKGELPLTNDTDPYVWLIDLDKLQQARVLINEYEDQQHDLVDWQCEKCGEQNEGQFALCWRCAGEQAT
ncbi:DUF2007 domain-containing protein [Vibrio sp. TH_r3]|uniref:putative signal transducing protein n=1 Tax=Vibrio sp. TH_r3 TaxID=3082084 RepID=UPI0029533445|nr:DUF2007 domain-containing protein [Vibrio sp. TH_r3]MDV7102992.1 DUF2007 domain-containing protein [Vibrio sp. TH_r3]